MKTRNAYSKSGLSTIELVSYTATFAIVIVAISLAFAFLYKTKTYLKSGLNVNRYAKEATVKLLEGLREADYSDAGAYPLELVSDYEIQFYSDYDNDAKIEKHKIYLDSGKLVWNVYESSGTLPVYELEKSKILARAVANRELSKPLFKYFDKTGKKISNPSENILQIRRVVFDLFLKAGIARKQSLYEFKIDVALRNIVNAYEK